MLNEKSIVTGSRGDMSFLNEMLRGVPLDVIRETVRLTETSGTSKDPKLSPKDGELARQIAEKILTHDTEYAADRMAKGLDHQAALAFMRAARIAKELGHANKEVKALGSSAAKEFAAAAVDLLNNNQLDEGAKVLGMAEKEAKEASLL